MGSRRFVRQTVLIAVEGDAEYNFVRQVRSDFTAGKVGHSVIIRNAGGKGALNVIDAAARLQRALRHNYVGAVFDEDVGWDDRARALARRHGIETVRSAPCFEATLLALHGIRIEADTAGYKRRFEVEFGAPAHKDGLLAKHFGRDVLLARRGEVPMIHAILSLIGV